ncbi:hypothetical protein E4U25_008426, partial [Claviceps purpurea]
GLDESTRRTRATKHIRDATVVSARLFKALAERAHRREEVMQLCSVSISDINKALDKLAESKQPMTRGPSRREPPTPSPWFRYEHSSRKRREREGPPTAARPALRY